MTNLTLTLHVLILLFSLAGLSSQLTVKSSADPKSKSPKPPTQRHQQQSKFSISTLTSTRFPIKISSDIDLDPCKSHSFLGDIALPNVNYELELSLQKKNKTLQEEIEKYKKEALLEGLQVEEEGLISTRTNEIKSKNQGNNHIRRENVNDHIHEDISKFDPLNNKTGDNANNINKKFKNCTTRHCINEAHSIQNFNSEDDFRENDEGRKITIRHKEIQKVENNRRGKRLKKRRRRSKHRAQRYSPRSRTLHHERLKRAATARKERVWDYGVIPYEIDGNFSGGHKALFKQAMRHWENFTCVKFVERNPIEHPNFIVFTERPCGCCSFVGKRGNGAQAISIGKNCDKFGIVVHELGHVVGFWHEHTRPDRDNHVQIVRDNIMIGQEYNFNKLTDDEVDSLGLAYDYESIMHYARNTFSKGSYLDTIQPIDYHLRGLKRRPEIGQRIRLSEGDIAQTNLLYKCQKCGRTFQENSGTISSPDYKNAIFVSPDGDQCEWRITATHGEKIVVNITDLDIIKTADCKTDYLEIRDGYWHKSKLLGKFCGTGSIDNQIISTGSRMLISYATSASRILHRKRGFKIYYEAVCGGEVDVLENGQLESPNYPEDYQPSKDCVWKLTAPPDYQVAIKFQSFDIENHDNCAYDYVEIRDGHSIDAPLIGRYCGYKLPPDIHSSQNKLLLKFVSDNTVQKAGFAASFMREFDECTSLEHGCEQYCINTLGGYECACKLGYELHSDGKHCEDACGGILEVSNGTITSPSFPELYPTNKNCIWEIIAPLQYRITLNFTHFDLEGNNVFQQECEYDSLEVHSKMRNDALRKHGIFCGNRLPPMVTSESNSLRIEFSSDGSVQKSGFAAVFFTDMDECENNNGGCQHECRNTIGSYSCSCRNGFTLHPNGHDCKESGCKHEQTAPYGHVTSPNFPEFYPSRKDCVWHFTTTPGHRIKLVFTVFEMEPHQECAYDHIVVYDGDSPDANTLGRFCGSKVPHPLIASSNQMYMAFKSDASVQRKGFNATHSTVCGGHLLATTQVKHLYSHSKYGDHNYDNKADCDWTIEAPPGMNIRLTFLTFEIEDEKDCQYDYVEVYSGLDASGPSYGRFCGNSNPTDITTVTEALLVRFRTDDTLVSKGFSASYTAIQAPNQEEILRRRQEEEEIDSDIE